MQQLDFAFLVNIMSNIRDVSAKIEETGETSLMEDITNL